jgi:uncharacterized OsmC-like protein
MRNGLNISGVSELVHEVQTKPEEAIIRFRAEGRPRHGGTEVSVRTATHGTIRMARDFRLALQPITGSTPAELTPEETALAALGACVLITHIFGYSTRGASLNELAVRVNADLPMVDGGAGPRSFENIRYEIDVDLDDHVDPALPIGLVKFVTSFSPNHRAYLDPSDFQVDCELYRSSGDTEQFTLHSDEIDVPPPAPQEAPRLAIGASLRWEYSTQTVPATWCGGPGATRPVEPGFFIDQPKQMVGIDRGPNPQEVMLVAVCADLSTRLHHLGPITVRGGGQLDIRGAMNIRKESPARFHALRFDVEAHTDAPLATVREAITAAVRDSAVLDGLRTPKAVSVEVRRSGKPVFEFTSNQAYALQFLAEMAEQQRAQQAAANAGQDGTRPDEDAQ